MLRRVMSAVTLVLVVGVSIQSAMAVLIPAPTGYWRFDDSGNRGNDYANGYDVVPSSGAAFAPGLIGDALYNGPSQVEYARRPIDDAAFNVGSTDFTVQVWINFDSTTGEQVFIEDFNGGAGPGWTFYKSSAADNHLEFYGQGGGVVSTGALSFVTNDGNPATTTDWNHLVARRSGGVLDIFQNGVLVGSGAMGSILPSVNPLLINARVGFGTPVSGLNDEVAFWNQALSNTEIAEAYSNGLTGLSLPEPTALGLLAVGGLFMFRRSARRRRIGASLAILAVALTISASASRSNAAVEILYNFENPGDNSSTVIDALAGDGAQNSTYGYSSGNVVPGSGMGVLGTTTRFLSPSAQPPGKMIVTDTVISYPTAMTWSAAVMATEETAAGYRSLFWSGVNRGPGETGFDITPTGNLSFYQNGVGVLITSASGLITPGLWTALGVTFDGTTGVLTFYKDGLPVQTFTGLGPMVNNGNAQGISVTDFGLTWNVSGQFSSQFIGYADNIFMADRALTASEMAAIQFIPEPSLASVFMMAGVLSMGARRRKQSV